MKYVLIAILTVFISSTVIAADGDITAGVTETRTDISSWTMKEVWFNVPTQVCKVTYDKLDIGGTFTGKRVDIIFSGQEFIDVVTAINNGNNIKNTITAAVKIKLGI